MELGQNEAISYFQGKRRRSRGVTTLSISQYGGDKSVLMSYDSFEQGLLTQRGFLLAAVKQSEEKWILHLPCVPFLLHVFVQM